MYAMKYGYVDDWFFKYIIKGQSTIKFLGPSNEAPDESNMEYDLRITPCSSKLKKINCNA